MKSNTPNRPSGMFGLTIVLIGQAISILASSMTGFALSIWVFQQRPAAPLRSASCRPLYLFLGFPNSVHIPLVLLRTGNDSLILGAVETAGAISWTVGSLLMSVCATLNGVFTARCWVGFSTAYLGISSSRWEVARRFGFQPSW